MNKIHIKNLYIHIGAHKTGSTFLQKYFFENQALLSRYNILYPMSGCASLFGHHDLYSGLKSDDGNFSHTVDGINNELCDNHDSLLLSSENFEYLTRIEIEKLINIFKFDRIKIIYFYRTWAPLLYAMWQEDVKHGSVTAFDGFALKHIAFPFGSTLLNYSIPLQNYEDVVGKSNLFVANYETATSTSLLDVMLHIIDAKLNFQNGVPNAEVNVSFDPFLVEAIRMMNVFAENENIKRSYKPKHYYINHACQGVAGVNRHALLISYMKDYKIMSHNYNKSFGFRLLISDFIDKYKCCFVDSIENYRDVSEINIKPYCTISHNYLSRSQVLDLLYSAWCDIRSFCL